MSQSALDFPFHIGPRGRTGRTGWDDHVRDLVEQVLFTSPGERVNRPEFGCGVQDLVFMGNSDALATATEFQVQGALERWLGDVIRVENLQVTADGERLEITIVYVLRETGRRTRETFSSPSSGPFP